MTNVAVIFLLTLNAT